MTPSEYRTQREEEQKTAAEDDLRGGDAAMADAIDESTLVDYEEDDALACDDISTSDVVPMSIASPEAGEVVEDRVGASPAPNPFVGLDGGLGAVITNRTDDDEYVDGMRPRILNTPERFPWRITIDTYRQWNGHRSANYPIALFDCTSLMDNQASSEVSDRTRYFTDLFFRHRFAEGKASSDALTQAWNAFVINFNNGPTAWVDRMTQSEARYGFRSQTGRAIAVHQLSRRLLVPCCVGTDVQCPMCTSSSLRLTREEMQAGPWAQHVTPELRVLCDTLDNGFERDRELRGRDATTRGTSRSRPLDRGRPRSSSRGPPTYRTREGTHAIGHGTYVSAFDQAFDPGDQQARPQSNVVAPTHPPVVEAEVGTPRTELQAVQSRVTAVESRAAEQATGSLARVNILLQVQADVSNLRSTLDESNRSLAETRASLEEVRVALKGSQARAWDPV